MSRFDNSSAAAQAARNAANARATGAKPPAQTSKVPNPAYKPLTLPKVQNVTINPDLTGRK